MKNTKKRINIIDLIFIVLIVGVVVFLVSKAADIKNMVNTSAVTKVSYVVEIPNQSTEILKYIEVDDKVYEDESLKFLGTVLDVTSRPYKLNTEDTLNKKIVESEMPGKIAVDVTILADADKTNGNISVDSVNLLVGKMIDLNIGNAYAKGVIIDVKDVNEITEVQE